MPAMLPQSPQNSEQIQPPGWRQAGQAFLLFTLMMVLANTLLLLLESQLGLYSYFAAVPLELLEPARWVRGPAPVS